MSHSTSGIEASGCPAGIAPREPDAIVEAVASPSPEFECDRNEAEASPMGWSKHRPAFEARGRGIDLEKQGLTIRERLRLSARDGPEPTPARTTSKVGIRLYRIDRLDRAPGADLPAQAFPVEDDRGLRVLGKLHALGGPLVGEEHKSALVVGLQQHDTGVWEPIASRGGECHGMRVIRLRESGLRHPHPEQGPRINVALELVHFGRWRCAVMVVLRHCFPSPRHRFG